MNLNNFYNAWEDGVTHLNIHPNSKFKHVRQLTDLAKNELIHPVHGKFCSMRGLIYYLVTSNENMRNKYGYDLEKGVVAKDKRKKINKARVFKECVNILIKDSPEFRDAIFTTFKAGLPIAGYRYSGTTYVLNIYHKELVKYYIELKKKWEAGHALY